MILNQDTVLISKPSNNMHKRTYDLNVEGLTVCLNKYNYKEIRSKDKQHFGMSKETSEQLCEYNNLRNPCETQPMERIPYEI